LRLEAQIEKLTEAIERCRKAILVSKVAIAAGGIWLLAFTFGAIEFDPMAMIAAISAVIGGTVVFGSNTSTSKQALVEITAAEALRAELIGKINLRVVERLMVRRCVWPGRYPLGIRLRDGQLSIGVLAACKTGPGSAPNFEPIDCSFGVER
jgi:hypothetical protein